MGNDFGWAVTQMLKGKNCRCASWHDKTAHWTIRGEKFEYTASREGTRPFDSLNHGAVIATDWEEYLPLPHAATPYTVNIEQAFEDVREFMTEISRRAGRWMPGMPGSFDLVRNSRIRMIFEEWNETATAIERKDEAGELDGLVDLLYVIVGGAIETEIPAGSFYRDVLGEHLSKAVACAIAARPGWYDSIHVSINTLEQYFVKSGLPVGAAWDEVHAANMRKFNGGHYDAQKGKWCKPADWVGPDITGILKRYPRKTDASK